jgi:MFS family permease
MTEPLQRKDTSHDHVKFNAIVNIMDGVFFGSALGFASFITIIPLFVSQLTDSPILIGLVPAIHIVGWQLPQLFTSGRIRRLPRYKPMVLAMTTLERLPFLGLALLAWTLPGLGRTTALALVFLLLVWQGIGGGLTATVWQSMVSKIIPRPWRGRFFGTQSSAANLLASITAVIAGQILERYNSPVDFTLCFLLASGSMAISFVFLAATREQDHEPSLPTGDRSNTWSEVKRLLAADAEFRWFLLQKFSFQLGLGAFSYYAVYAVGELGASAGLAGWLTGVLIFCDMLANLVLGVLGDRKGHRVVLLIGALTGLLSVALAGWLTSIPAWFVIFGLAGVATVVGWTTTMVFSLEFGSLSEQSTYIGMANTLVAPATMAAPFLAGWLIEAFGYPVMFQAAALVFLITVILSFRLLRHSRPKPGHPA